MGRVKVLVPVSGGKDSQACLKLATETYQASEIRGLFCDTQFEHPWTYEHVERMQDIYGVRIDRVCGGSVLEKSKKYGRFPGGGARHCTDELKIRETRIYLKALADEQGGFEVWYGMRSGESPERRSRYRDKVSDAVYLPHEVLPGKYPKYLGNLGVMFRLAILDWTTDDVTDFVGWYNLNPLYFFDFDRVGCFPCLASGDVHKERAFAFGNFGRERYRKVLILSDEIGKSVWTSKGGIARHAEDNPG